MSYLSRTVGALLSGALLISSASAETLRMGHDQPEAHGYQEVGRYLEKRLKEELGDDWAVSIFPGAQLGSEMAMLDSVIAGNLDMSIAATANASTFVPELGLFSVSYVFEDVDHFRRVINDQQFNDMIDEIIASKELGIRRIATFTAGVRNVYNAEKPITSLDDLANMKMRVMASPVESKVWGQLGTLPVSIPFGDVYTGMQTGLVQAAENAAAVYASNKHYEVAPYYSLTGHQWLVAMLYMSDLTYEGLSDEAKAALETIGQEMPNHIVDYVLASDAEFVERMKSEFGVQVNEVDPAPFAERLAATQDEVAAELGVEDLLARVRELK
jgi:tripartite ATP-independent transporter DctP family solute receptor